MSKFTNEKTTYFVVRNRNNQEEVMQYNEYSGTIVWYVDAEFATEFDTAEQAKKLADVQGLLAKITGQTATFEVFRKHEKSGPDGKVEAVAVESEAPAEESEAVSE